MSTTALPTIVVLHDPAGPAPAGIEALNERARIRHATDRDELRAAIADAEVLLVMGQRPLVAEVWPHAERLRWIHVVSAGVDALVFPELAASDVLLTNARGMFDRAIAETVLGMVLYFAKDMPTTTALQRRREWRHRETEVLQGTRALIVGTGTIGREIGRILGAVGVATTAVARRARSGDPDFARVHGPEVLHECLADADWVVIATPLTAQTRGLFDREAFAAMKPGARLINIGRGPVVVTDDLVAALRAGTIAGAALDVFEEEPLPPEHPLWAFDNVLVSPHMAGDFIGWQRALMDQFRDCFDRWQAGEALPNTVDKQRGYVPTRG